MKKSIIISASVILAIVVIFFSLYLVVTTPKQAGNFSVDKFTEYIENENFQTEENYGEIIDFKSAAKAGKTAISERFQDSDGGVFEWMGCSVKYDAENVAYYIRTHHVNPLMKGGAHDVIIQSDGKVLAIWGEK